MRKTPRFDKDLAELPEQVRAKAKEQYRIFKENWRHPSLRTKKMEGYDDIFEGHITLGYVFTFQWDGDTAVFRRIGKHDEVYANP